MRGCIAKSVEMCCDLVYLITHSLVTRDTTKKMGPHDDEQRVLAVSKRAAMATLWRL